MPETAGHIAHQVHDRFKVFEGALEPDHSIATLASQVAEFARQPNVAAKSIGVEYLEGEKRVLLTLGYRDDAPGYPIKVQTVSLGELQTLDTAHFAQLEAAMEQASSQFANIICHAEYVTQDNEFVMVFMTHDD